MLNVSDEPSTSGGTVLRENPTQNKQYDLSSTLRPEEINMYKNCTFSLYYKAGIPFALFCHVVSSFRSGKVEQTPSKFLKKGFIFFGNMLLGTLLFTPVCYSKLMAMRSEYEKQKKEMESQKVPTIEGLQPGTELEDFSYPVDVVANFNEPEGSFSSDFDSSRLLIEDEEKKNVPSTTYQDLRARHRNSYRESKAKSLLLALSPEFEEQQAPTPPPAPADKLNEPTPRKIVKKNKYGDEIE